MLNVARGTCRERVCRETLPCYTSEGVLPIVLQLGMSIDTHQPNPLEESDSRARAAAYPIFELEEFPGL